MPGRPCTPKAGAETDSANVPVDGHRHQFGREVGQPDYASPPFRVVWSCSSRFGNQKGGTLRISSAVGFNPAPLPPRANRPPTPWNPGPPESPYPTVRGPISAVSLRWNRPCPGGSGIVPEPDRPPPAAPPSLLRSLTRGSDVSDYRRRERSSERRPTSGGRGLRLARQIRGPVVHVAGGGRERRGVLSTRSPFFRWLAVAHYQRDARQQIGIWRPSNPLRRAHQATPRGRAGSRIGSCHGDPADRGRVPRRDPEDRGRVPRRDPEDRGRVPRRDPADFPGVGTN